MGYRWYKGRLLNDEEYEEESGRDFNGKTIIFVTIVNLLGLGWLFGDLLENEDYIFWIVTLLIAGAVANIFLMAKFKFFMILNWIIFSCIILAILIISFSS